MDIVHHSLIGGSGFLIASAVDQPLAGTAFVMGSVFPDLDVVFIILGKRFYLRNHQAITHSLFLAPVYSLVICLGFFLLLDLSWDWLIVSAFLAGILLHVTLDWCNTFKIALFSPFIKKRYSLDAVFFIDTVSLALTALFYLLYGYLRIEFVAWLYVVSFAIYFTWKYKLHQNVMRRLSPQFAIPSAWNPFEFYILEITDQEIRAYLYNALSDKKSAVQTYSHIDPSYYQLARNSKVFRDMQMITRAMFITEVRSDGQATIIEAADLAVRNFNSRFAKTTLMFDSKGSLTSELANI